jgi:hypothetical protein
MPTVTVKRPDELARALVREAQSRGVPKSEVIRTSLEHALAKTLEDDPGPSCYDLIADLDGAFDGPRDASTNKRYLSEAIIREHKHGGRRHR